MLAGTRHLTRSRNCLGDGRRIDSALTAPRLRIRLALDDYGAGLVGYLDVVNLAPCPDLHDHVILSITAL
jgi:hypothetical protein